MMSSCGGSLQMKFSLTSDSFVVHFYLSGAKLTYPPACFPSVCKKLKIRLDAPKWRREKHPNKDHSLLGRKPLSVAIDPG